MAAEKPSQDQSGTSGLVVFANPALSYGTQIPAQRL